MNRKYFLFMLQFLTSICIVSVGFSSWTIVSEVSIKASGIVSSEDVHYNEKYISKASHEVFRYYDTGFLKGEDKKAEIVQTAQIKYEYVLLLTNLETDLNGKTSTIKFTLSHAEIEDFAFIDKYLSSIDVLLGTIGENAQEIEYTNLEVTNHKTNNIYTIELTFGADDSDLANAIDGDHLQIVYNFEVPKDGDSFNFESDIFPYISSDEFHFAHKLEVLFEE